MTRSERPVEHRQVFEVIDLRLHRLLGSYTLQASREPTTAAPRSRTACRWAWRRAATATCSRHAAVAPEPLAVESGLPVARKARRETIGGRQGITTPLSNVSQVTGEREYVALSTTQLRDGSLLNIIGVAPQSEAKTYENTFRRVRQSLQIAD